MLISIKKNYKDYQTRYENTEIEGAKIEEIENNNDASKFFNGFSHMQNITSKSYLNLDEFLNLGLSLSLFPIIHKMNSVSQVLAQKSFKKDEYIEDLKNIFIKYSKKIGLN